jgi:hypothetical protein
LWGRNCPIDRAKPCRSCIRPKSSCSATEPGAYGSTITGRTAGIPACSPPADLDTRLLAAKKSVLHLWLRLLAIYDGTQPLSDEKTATAAAPPHSKGAPHRRRTASTEDQEPHAPLPKYPTETERTQFEERTDSAATVRELDSIIKDLPRSIELRTSPIAVAGYRNRAPVLRTRSALGLMKAATQSGAAAQSGAPIVFLPAVKAEHLRAEPRNSPDLKTGFSCA